MGFENKFRKISFCMECGAEIKDLILEDQKGCIIGCEEFKYYGVTIDKKNKQENYIKSRINKGRAVIAMLNSVLWNRQITKKKQVINI